MSRRFPFSALAAVIAVGAAVFAQQSQSAPQSAAPPQSAQAQSAQSQNAQSQNAQPQDGQVQVTQAWARATPGKSTIGAAYATVTAAAGDRLVGVSTPVAGVAQIHQHTMEGGIMKMRQVDAVPLPAGQAVTLSPGGYHIMLIDLKAPLVAGQSFPLTLTFEKAGAVETSVAVGGVGASGPAGAGSGMAPMNMGGTMGHKG